MTFCGDREPHGQYGACPGRPVHGHGRRDPAAPPI